MENTFIQIEVTKFSTLDLVFASLKNISAPKRATVTYNLKDTPELQMIPDKFTVTETGYIVEGDVVNVIGLKPDSSPNQFMKLRVVIEYFIKQDNGKNGTATFSIK